MKKILWSLVGLILLSIAIVVGVVSTVDVDKYRGQIVETLSHKTGRVVQLNSPLHLGLSWDGVVLSIQDASISNPSWARRPNMADVGRFRLGVALLPLLQKKLVIKDLQLTNADIQLETKADKKNWDLQLSEPSTTKADSAKTDSSSSSATVRVDKLSIEGSQLSILDETGKPTLFKVKTMTLGMEGKGLALHFMGDHNGAPIRLDLKTGAEDMEAKGPWPFDLDLRYGSYHVVASGKADLGAKKIDLESYKITAGDVTTDLSDLHGQMNITWGDKRPTLQGSVMSNHLNLVDFMMSSEVPNRSEASAAASSTTKSQHVFSDEPLPLDKLKLADVKLDIGLDDVVHGDVTFKQIMGQVVLNNAVLLLDPLKLTLGKSDMTGQFKLDGAQTPAQMGLSFSATAVDLGDLLHLSGLEAFLSGKANATINLASTGNSPHELASHLGGSINVVADDGHVSETEAGLLSPNLMKILAPRGASALNCLATRFLVANGLVRSNGILVDTTMTTISGSGGFDLGHETINLVLHPRPKVAIVGDLIPPLSIGGTFLNPEYDMDPQAILHSVNGLLHGDTDGDVPELETKPGQNACLYTLDNPGAERPPTSVMKSGLGGRIDKIKKMGGHLLNLLGE